MKSNCLTDEEWRKLTPDQRVALKEEHDTVSIPNCIAALAAIVAIIAMVCVVIRSEINNRSHHEATAIPVEIGTK